MTERYTSEESIPLAERCGSEKPFPLERHRMMMRHASAEDYIHIALQAIMQQAAGKITKEFFRKYNRTKGHIPVRHLTECSNYPRDSWEFAQRAIEMTAIIDHNDMVERAGVGEKIFVADLPRPGTRTEPSVEEV